MKRLDCHDSLKEVLGNYRTAIKTVQVLIDLAVAEPAVLHDNDLELADLKGLKEELDALYITRLFAVFENALRSCWRSRIRASTPATQVLINSVAGRFGVPDELLELVQGIRQYRNALIHEEAQADGTFRVDEASSHLNQFLARLPLEW
jgi:hypothetical protein